MNKALPEIVWGILSDVPGVPTGTAKAVFDSYRERKRMEAREILLDKIGSGVDFQAQIKNDEFLDILHRFALAVSDGRAKRNLELLAEAIANQLEGGEVDSDEFNGYANTLETLTLNEIKLLGTFYRIYEKYEGTSPNKRTGRGFRPNTQVDMDRAWGQLNKEMVHVPFPSQAHLRATASGLVRTGLLIPETYADGTHYHLTVLAKELCGKINFD